MKKQAFFTSTIAFLAMVFLFSPLKAQQGAYNTLVGVRAGTSLGGTVKWFVTDDSAVELMAFNR